MEEIIELKDCPKPLQMSVNSYLERFPDVEILSVQTWKSTPYKDKSIVDTKYSVFTVRYNYFSVYSLTVSSKEEWNHGDVRVNNMIAGEITEIVKLSPMWFG